MISLSKKHIFWGILILLFFCLFFKNKSLEFFSNNSVEEALRKDLKDAFNSSYNYYRKEKN